MRLGGGRGGADAASRRRAFPEGGPCLREGSGGGWRARRGANRRLTDGVSIVSVSEGEGGKKVV